MKNPRYMIFTLSAGVAAALALSDPALAQTAAPAVGPAATDGLPADGRYIFNTLLFLIGGVLVMWMACGFAMLEAGMVRTKNVAIQCTKNIGIYAIAGLLYWVVGYNLMYSGVDGGLIGSFAPKSIPDPGSDPGDYAAGSDWFYQMAFCATAASIVSGTLAERIRLWPFLAFVAILCGVIYPVQGAWKWGGGWLDGLGFLDFAGSTLVHSTGGWAALTGAIILGARNGKYGPGGKVFAIPGSNMPLATLGAFILWLGWFGFNGASQLALGSIQDASAVSRIFVNTNLAASAGVVAAMALAQLCYGKVDLTFALNGALAGLVSITAEPLTPSPLWSVIIGGIGGAIVVFAVPLLDRFRIDDVVGAIPVHLCAGIWGTLAVPITNGDGSFVTQAIGILSIGAFVAISSAILWSVLNLTIGIRPSLEAESDGLDMSECGMEAYPEFGTGSQRV